MELTNFTNDVVDITIREVTPGLLFFWFEAFYRAESRASLEN
jgi:hypothetical protein